MADVEKKNETENPLPLVEITEAAPEPGREENQKSDVVAEPEPPVAIPSPDNTTSRRKSSLPAPAETAGSLPIQPPATGEIVPPTTAKTSIPELKGKDPSMVMGASIANLKKRYSTVDSLSFDSEEEDELSHRKRRSKSRGRLTLGSVISLRRASQLTDASDRHRAARYMNSYKLESDNPFHIERVEKIIQEILTEALEGVSYDHEKIPKQAKWASSAIRTKVKEQEYDRYKFICIVTLGEKRSQDMLSVFRFLWDQERDKYAMVVHENMSLFAIAICFGIYYE